MQPRMPKGNGCRPGVPVERQRVDPASPISTVKVGRSAAYTPQTLMAQLSLCVRTRESLKGSGTRF